MGGNTSNLNSELWNYYRSVGEIEDEAMDKAKGVIEALRQDFDCFRKTRGDKGVFIRMEPAGSAFEGLKVQQPDEFDLMLVLHIPQPYQNEVLTAFPVDKLSERKERKSAVSTKYKALKFESLDGLQLQAAMIPSKWIDNEKFIYHEYMLQQFQGVIDQFKDYVNTRDGEYTVDTNQLKPGMKLRIVRKTGEPSTINVDILPVILASVHRYNWEDRRRLFSDKNPPEVVSHAGFDLPWGMFWDRICSAAQDRYAINYNHWPTGLFIARPPKPLAGSPVGHYIWRECFTIPERELFTNNTSGPSFLATIRIVKSLRCEPSNTELVSASSYVIKTIAMHLSQTETRWEEKDLTARVKQFLSLLLEYVQVGHLPSFWRPDHNELGEMTPNQRRAVVNFLKKRLDVVSLLPLEYRRSSGSGI